MITVSADRHLTRSSVSASDRPVPPDLDVVSAIEARHARRLHRRELDELERTLRSESGRLERSIAHDRWRRMVRDRSGRRRPEDDAASARASAREADALARHQELLQAIRRVEAGTYGHCVRCHAPIEHERLAADPNATLCTAHAPYLS